MFFFASTSFFRENLNIVHAWRLSNARCINFTDSWNMQKSKEHTVDLSMLIIMHRLRTKFYYLPFHSHHHSALWMRNAFCVHRKDTLFSDDKSHEQNAFSTFFPRPNISVKNGDFLFHSIELHNARNATPGGIKFIGLHRQFLYGVGILRWTDGRKKGERSERWRLEKYPSLRELLCAAFALKLFRNGSCI